MLIVLVTVDCGRADHMDGSSGLTPQLDSMREQGTTFTQAFSQSQNTLSSHLSILTSNYLFQHGAYTNYTRRILPDHAVPRRLESRGWTCGGFAGAHFLSMALAGQLGKIDGPFASLRESLWQRAWTRPWRRPDRVCADSTIRAALEWLGALEPSRDGFLWLHLFDTHMVYHAPRRFLRMEDSWTRTPRSCREQVETRGWYCTAHRDYGKRVSVEYFPARYRAAVRYVDACLGRFVHELVRRGWWDDTMLVLTADHGECLQGDHDLYCMHKKLFDATVHVPLWIRFPAGAHAGRTVDGLVELVDVAPTIAAAVGFHEPLYMGVDLARVAAGDHPGREYVFSEHVDNTFRAVRDREFIWIDRPETGSPPPEYPVEAATLFHRDGTPVVENTDDRERRLEAFASTLMTSRPDVRGAWKSGEDVDEAIAEHLTRLGYLPPRE